MDLTPDRVIKCAEIGLGIKFSSYIEPLPSYINRVYEVESQNGDRYIIKFYRPDRWTIDGILDEHDFIRDCLEEEIPVVPPLNLKNESTLYTDNDLNFAIFNKKQGRLIELNTDEDWIRLGAIIGRMHRVGSQYEVENRIIIHPQESTVDDVEYLVQSGVISEPYLTQYRDVTNRIIKLITPLFNGIELQRIHGDCHGGNILERPGEGLMLIDFDDMATGPRVQDLWLLLPGYLKECHREKELLLEGYNQFSYINPREWDLVEPLRAMRMIYFTSWCSTQIDDSKFLHNFPHWGSTGFWEKEITDLEQQYQIIYENTLVD